MVAVHRVAVRARLLHRAAVAGTAVARDSLLLSVAVEDTRAATALCSASAAIEGSTVGRALVLRLAVAVSTEVGTTHQVEGEGSVPCRRQRTEASGHLAGAEVGDTSRSYDLHCERALDYQRLLSMGIAPHWRSPALSHSSAIASWSAHWLTEAGMHSRKWARRCAANAAYLSTLQTAPRAELEQRQQRALTT